MIILAGRLPPLFDDGPVFDRIHPAVARKPDPTANPHVVLAACGLHRAESQKETLRRRPGMLRGGPAPPSRPRVWSYEGRPAALVAPLNGSTYALSAHSRKARALGCS